LAPWWESRGRSPAAGFGAEPQALPGKNAYHESLEREMLRMKIYDDQLIVITGGVGFIGSCLVRYLNDLGIRNLLLVDNLGRGDKWRNLQGKSISDIIHKQDLFSWLEGREASIEAFIHLGACSTTTETDANYILENNYRYSVRLAEYAFKNDIRFIYASSAATYGNGALGFVDSDADADLQKLCPLNMYGMSKHLFDRWVVSEKVLDKVTGLKFFNVFGPNEYHKGRMASAIYHMYKSVQKDGVIRLFQSTDRERFKDGDQQRDFIYVKDVVRMLHAFLLNDATGLYNIGSGAAHTWNFLAKAVFKALKRPVNIEYMPMPEDLIGKYQNYTCADMQKTTAVLHKKAHCGPLDNTVADYVTNHLAQDVIW
jgi:ADP-L-glycero-D-manno-heptose 6-epimerase